MRLRGKGATQRSSANKGDLYVHLEVVLPKPSDTAPLEDIARSLEPLYEDTNVREHLGKAR